MSSNVTYHFNADLQIKAIESLPLRLSEHKLIWKVKEQGYASQKQLKKLLRIGRQHGI